MLFRYARFGFLVGSLLLGAVGCASLSFAKGVAMSFRLSSPDFVEGGAMPRGCTCDGDDASPALLWDNIPEGTQSLALIVDDPDAPDPAAPKMTYVHWVLYNIPPSLSGLAAELQAPPEGAQEGINDWGRGRYGGPCPPIGRHRYFHKLYALNKALEFPKPPTKDELLAAMKGHILAETTLMGTYQRPSR